jgi:hypothetical protein
MLLVVVDHPQDAPIFLRGQPARPGRIVPRQLPSLLASCLGPEFWSEQSATDAGRPLATSGRKELARAIVDARNPLTARVLVNRVWQWHFGNGLVATANDFGKRSSGPTHPELLDYLARWFIDNGWSIKKLQRLIVSSRTYQQASGSRPDCVAIDPANDLLWRYSPRRLSWESMRDSLLCVSGRLRMGNGGRSIEAAPDDPETGCRTIYIRIDRQQVSRTAANFDFPAPDFPAAQRSSTTVPQQQLFFFNSPFVLKQADALAEWLVGQGEDNDRDLVQRLFQRVLSRPPNRGELDAALSYVRAEADPASGSVSSEAAGRPTADIVRVGRWARLAQALLISNEFVFIE